MRTYIVLVCLGFLMVACAASRPFGVMTQTEAAESWRVFHKGFAERSARERALYE